MKLELSIEEVKLLIDSIEVNIDVCDGLEYFENLNNLRNKLINSCDDGTFLKSNVNWEHVKVELTPTPKYETTENIDNLFYDKEKLTEIDKEQLIIFDTDNIKERRKDAIKFLNDNFGLDIKINPHEDKLTNDEYSYLLWILRSRTVSQLVDSTMIEIIMDKLKNFKED